MEYASSDGLRKKVTDMPNAVKFENVPAGESLLATEPFRRPWSTGSQRCAAEGRSEQFPHRRGRPVRRGSRRSAPESGRSKNRRIPSH
eukprot:3800045-Prymnesium_polylepis.2